MVKRRVSVTSLGGGGAGLPTLREGGGAGLPPLHHQGFGIPRHVLLISLLLTGETQREEPDGSEEDQLQDIRVFLSDSLFIQSTEA